MITAPRPFLSFKGRLHELKKGPVFSAKTERFTTYGTDIGAENRPFSSSCQRSLILIGFICPHLFISNVIFHQSNA